MKALETYPSPTTVKELKQWMGLVNYFVSHIRNRGELFVLLCALLKKDVEFNWTGECEEAMQEINGILTSDRVMGYCEFGKPLQLFTDASILAIGAALVQEDQETGLHWVIGYWGRALNQAERGWAVTPLNCWLQLGACWLSVFI